MFVEQCVDSTSTPTLKQILLLEANNTNASTYWGIPAKKCPNDFWIYMEMLHAIQPDVVVEIGNWYGGALLAYAHIMDNVGKGKVRGVDVDHSRIDDKARHHRRITLIQSDACEAIDKVKSLINPGDTVMVIEDSAHTYSNTLKVLETYSPLVSKNSYMVVEDSLINNGLYLDEFKDDGGPMKAIEDFLHSTARFVSDRRKERLFVTWNPKGYLKRVA